MEKIEEAIGEGWLIFLGKSAAAGGLEDWNIPTFHEKWVCCAVEKCRGWCVLGSYEKNENTLLQGIPKYGIICGICPECGQLTKWSLTTLQPHRGGKRPFRKCFN